MIQELFDIHDGITMEEGMIVKIYGTHHACPIESQGNWVSDRKESRSKHFIIVKSVYMRKSKNSKYIFVNTQPTWLVNDYYNKIWKIYLAMIQ